MNRAYFDTADDYYDFGEDSDQERAESSEDEIDIILHGTSEQRRQLRHNHHREQRLARSRSHSPGVKKKKMTQADADSSSEDEFEREMNRELEKTITMLEKNRAQPELQEASSSAGGSTGGSVKGRSSKAKSSFYSLDEFDSDDDDHYLEEGDTKKEPPPMTNDDLLYDPDLDDEDQRWVDNQRRRSNKGNNSGKRKGKGKNTSDAVLDCPACMTTLCLDCQRHEIYPTQYRAMFVMNCKVNTSELLSVPEKATKKKFRNKKGKGGGGAGEGSGVGEEGGDASKDQFHPVSCEECNTVVGVVDTDQVYHFFNVLTSRA